MNDDRDEPRLPRTVTLNRSRQLHAPAEIAPDEVRADQEQDDTGRVDVVECSSPPIAPRLDLRIIDEADYAGAHGAREVLHQPLPVLLILGSIADANDDRNFRTVLCHEYLHMIR